MKKLFLVSVAITLTLPILSHAQITFEKTYGGPGWEFGGSVQQTEDGGYIVAGVKGVQDSDCYLIKTDAYGDSLWAKTYGGDNEDSGYSVQQTTDRGYIIAGSTASSGYEESNVYLVKTNANGDSLWAKTYGGNDVAFGSSVQQTTDGGYIIAGSRASSLYEERDVYVIKTDSSGDTTWTRTYGGDDYDYGNSVQQTDDDDDGVKDDGFIIAGSTDSFGGVGEVYLIKTDAYGDTLWTRNYGGDGIGIFCGGFSVQQTMDGGYIASGAVADSVNWSLVYLIKTDSSGDTTWTRTYRRDTPAGAWDSGATVQQTTDGGYIIGGAKENPMLRDIYLIKTDADGDTLWTRTFGGDQRDFGGSVQQTRDGGYIIGGCGYSYGSGDIYLFKTDENGIVGIVDEYVPVSIIPKSFALSQNHPNPFNPSTTIKFDVPGESYSSQPVNLAIYDIRGRLVKTLADSEFEPGRHRVHWDGRNDSGEKVSSGIYLYRLKTGDKTFTRKMTLSK